MVCHSAGGQDRGPMKMPCMRMTTDRWCIPQCLPHNNWNYYPFPLIPQPPYTFYTQLVMDKDILPQRFFHGIGRLRPNSSIHAGQIASCRLSLAGNQT
eukprot:363066-Chlamydomonas_euryale.AAC.15